MIKFFKDKYLLLYFIGSLFFMESILRAVVIENFFSFGLIFSFIFSVFFAIILFVLSSFFEEKTNYILSSILLGIAAFIFSSQLVYYKIFRIFYAVYSFGNVSQVFEFWKDIWAGMLQNAIWITLIFSPAIINIAFRQKFLFYQKISKSYRIPLIYSIIFTHFIALGFVNLGSRETNSAYDLYNNSNYPILSVEKLGLLTTMRLDLQRLVLGWSPTLEVSAMDWSNTHINKTDHTLNKKHHALDITDEEKAEETIEYNIMAIDFDNLISNESNKSIQEMHTYFQKVQPTKKNEYTGKYKGYNLILITAEGFAPYAVHKDVTPTLYKLVNEGYKFTNFYNPLWGVSTSDGEYVASTSLIPKSGVWSFYHSSKKYMPFAMGNQLRKLDYKTMAYHNHTYTYYRRDVSHPNMGYDYKGIGNGLHLEKTWPESDLEMIQKTVPEYINNQPFHAYYMTVSGHMQYNFSGNAMALKNKEYVKDLPYLEAGKAYIATQVELDRALEDLLNQLEDAGVADKTLIALSPDHYPYGLKDNEISELLGHEVEKNFEIYKSTFILYTKNMEPITIDKPSSSLDIIPTLSNLLDLEYDSRLLMGRDIFSDSEPLVTFLNKSFITDKGRFNSITKEFTPNEGIAVEEDYINRISSVVNNNFYFSTKILETDYYKKVFNN